MANGLTGNIQRNPGLADPGSFHFSLENYFWIRIGSILLPAQQRKRQAVHLVHPEVLFHKHQNSC